MAVKYVAEQSASKEEASTRYSINGWRLEIISAQKEHSDIRWWQSHETEKHKG